MSFMAAVATLIRTVGDLPADQRDHAIRLLVEATEAAGNGAEESAEDRRKRRDRERKASRKSAPVSAEVPRNSVDLSAEPRASESIISSDLSPSQPASLQTDGPPSPPAVDTRPQEYRAAYERGIEQGKGSPYAMPTVQTGELHQAILAHQRDGAGKPLRGPALLKGIEWDARQFAEFVKGQPLEKARFWNYDPRAWLRWLNTAEVDESPAPAPRPVNGASTGNLEPG